jgi:hypothetical protein
MASFACLAAHSLMFGSDLAQALMYGAGKQQISVTK